MHIFLTVLIIALYFIIGIIVTILIDKLLDSSMKTDATLVNMITALWPIFAFILIFYLLGRFVPYIVNKVCK